MRDTTTPPNTSSLDELTIPEAEFAFTATLVEMSPDFRTRLLAAYANDSRWKRFQELLISLRKDSDPLKTHGIQFSKDQGLLYHVQDAQKRLCIPQALYQEIFQMAHDDHSHSGFHRTYERIARYLYLWRCAHFLRQYIKHCLDCQKNQTTRHKPYGSLKPITSPSHPFHTVTLDFIVELPPTAIGNGEFDACATLTYKFSKRILVEPGKTNWSAESWAIVLITSLISHGWGIPQAIISNLDAKFMSDFWKTVFQNLNTRLLTSTSYHPQTDGQSERTNQVLEIALRFFLTSHPEKDWTAVIHFFQGGINNISNASTGHSPNEIVYGFRVRDTLNSLLDLLQDLQLPRSIMRQEASDAISFANVVMKQRYDQKHKPIQIHRSWRLCTSPTS